MHCNSADIKRKSASFFFCLFYEGKRTVKELLPMPLLWEVAHITMIVLTITSQLSVTQKPSSRDVSLFSFFLLFKFLSSTDLTVKTCTLGILLISQQSYYFTLLTCKFTSFIFSFYTLSEPYLPSVSHLYKYSHIKISNTATAGYRKRMMTK